MAKSQTTQIAQLHKALKVSDVAYVAPSTYAKGAVIGTNYFFVTADAPVARTLLGKYNLAADEPTLLDVNGSINRREGQAPPAIDQVTPVGNDVTPLVVLTRMQINGRAVYVGPTVDDPDGPELAVFTLPDGVTRIFVNRLYVEVIDGALGGDAPLAQWRGIDQLKPIRCDYDGKLVGVVMPVRVEKP